MYTVISLLWLFLLLFGLLLVNSGISRLFSFFSFSQYRGGACDLHFLHYCWLSSFPHVYDSFVFTTLGNIFQILCLFLLSGCLSFSYWFTRNSSPFCWRWWWSMYLSLCHYKPSDCSLEILLVVLVVTPIMETMKRLWHSAWLPNKSALSSVTMSPQPDSCYFR